MDEMTLHRVYEVTSVRRMPKREGKRTKRRSWLSGAGQRYHCVENGMFKIIRFQGEQVCGRCGAQLAAPAPDAAP